MVGRDLIELELELQRDFKKYYEDPLSYLRIIKDLVKRKDPSARVFLFGSIVKGTLRPDSDIDVLIVTELAEDVGRRLSLRVEIAREIGVNTPFEIHIVSPEEYKWYERFIDRCIEV